MNANSQSKPTRRTDVSSCWGLCGATRKRPSKQRGSETTDSATQYADPLRHESITSAQDEFEEGDIKINANGEMETAGPRRHTLHTLLTRFRPSRKGADSHKRGSSMRLWPRNDSLHEQTFTSTTNPNQATSKTLINSENTKATRNEMVSRLSLSSQSCKRSSMNHSSNRQKTVQLNNERSSSKLGNSGPLFDDAQLQCAIGSCEQRLSQLNERLKWLQDSPENSNPVQSTELTLTRMDARLNPEESSKGDTRLQTDLADMEKQIGQISESLRYLKCHIESQAYLSWLGVVKQPQASIVAVPGRRAPPPNPQMHLIRRPDIECRASIQEYQRLCLNPIPDHVRMELRECTFNNWPWSDAWLIRFVRQMFVDLKLVEQFHLQLAKLDLWLCDVYRRYNRVPFHNYKHAFMVTQMAYTLLWSANLNVLFEKEQQLILLIATICHDLDHPGFNNSYQINAGTELAVRYNDQSPLENHHCAMAFDILGNYDSNPFSHLMSGGEKYIREGVIQCILATDMSRHNEIVNHFHSVILNDLDAAWAIDAESGKPTWITDKTQRDLAMMVLIKVSDISNESRPLSVAGQWINRLLAEFFHQSDYEKITGLPVTPFMDREKVTKPASQCGFIRFVILPLFESLTKLFPSLKPIILQPAIEQLNHYTELQKLEEEEEAAKLENLSEFNIEIPTQKYTQ